MENLIITGLTTIIVSVVSIYLTLFFQRSKPWIGIKGIRYDDRTLINISGKIYDLMLNSRIIKPFEKQNVPIRQIYQCQSNIRSAEFEIDGAIRILDNFENSLDNEVLTDEKKIEKILELTGNNYLNFFLGYLNSCGTLTFQPFDLEEVQSNHPKILNIKQIENQKNAEVLTLFYKDSSKYNILSTNLGFFPEEYFEKTNVIATIMQYFLIPQLKDIISKLKKEITKQGELLKNIYNELDNIIKKREIIISVEMVNRGKTPCHIESTGYLKVKTGGKEFAPFKLTAVDYNIQESGMEDMPRMMRILEGFAEKQGIEATRLSNEELQIPESIIINPSQTIKVEMSVIQNKNDDDVQLVELYKEGMISCQVFFSMIGKKINSVIFSELYQIGKDRDEYRDNKLLKKINNIYK